MIRKLAPAALAALALTAGAAAAQHHVLGVVLGQVREVGCLARHQLAEAGQPLAAEQPPPSLQQQAEEVGGGARVLGQHPLAGFQVGPHHLLHHRAEEVFLAGEVEVHGALGHAGALRDLVHLGGREALLHEQVQRRLHDLAGARLAPAPPARAVLLVVQRVLRLLAHDHQYC